VLTLTNNIKKMAKQIFINLAVKDLQKSMDFYTALGFTNNPQFSDNAGKCMVWSDNIFLMLLTHEKFATFATKPIADTKSGLAGLFSLSLDSVEQVNTMMENGLKAGGVEPHEMRDYGFMQQRTIEDFDGHTWEIFFMDLSKFPTDQPA
jgi:predicted lactoylglutathione lyase